MTNRQRFRETMCFGRPDRVLCFEEGIREDVLQVWHQQGLSLNTNVSNILPVDHFFEIALDVDPLPSFNKWPTEKLELDSLRNRLNPDNPSRLPSDWHKKVRSWKTDDQVLFLRVHRGFFLSMGVHDWSRFLEVMNLLTEDPEFIREAMLIQGEFAARFFDKVLTDIEVDAAIFHEPIAGNEGPLISPAMYEEFVLRSYRPMLEVLHKHNINTIIFRTYANARILIPYVLKYGLNCLWACETNAAAMDYRDLRNEFGNGLRLIGGIDLDALRRDKDSIRREVEAKVPPVLADGGYVPMVDGRIRRDIPFENYVYYRRLLEQTICTV